MQKKPKVKSHTGRFVCISCLHTQDVQKVCCVTCGFVPVYTLKKDGPAVPNLKSKASQRANFRTYLKEHCEAFPEYKINWEALSGEHLAQVYKAYNPQYLNYATVLNILSKVTCRNVRYHALINHLRTITPQTQQDLNRIDELLRFFAKSNNKTLKEVIKDPDVGLIGTAEVLFNRRLNEVDAMFLPFANYLVTNGCTGLYPHLLHRILLGYTSSCNAETLYSNLPRINFLINQAPSLQSLFNKYLGPSARTLVNRLTQLANTHADPKHPNVLTYLKTHSAVIDLALKEGLMPKLSASQMNILSNEFSYHRLLATCI